MKLLKTIIALLILPICFALGNYFVPPVAKPVVDSSTGLQVPPGFEVDLVYEVDKSKFGSWIAMAFDDKGRLTVSDQQKAGTFILDIPQRGKKLDESKIRKLNVASSLYGMLYAFDHLYMMGNLFWMRLVFYRFWLISEDQVQIAQLSTDRSLLQPLDP